jgi:hypothetical protein
MQTLEELVKQLPPELHQEVQDFVEFCYISTPNLLGPSRILSGPGP